MSISHSVQCTRRLSFSNVVPNSAYLEINNKKKSLANVRTWHYAQLLSIMIVGYLF